MMNMTPAASTLLTTLVTTGSPDLPVTGAPAVVSELVAIGYLRQTADRYEVTARAWVDLNACADEAPVAPRPAPVAARIRVRGLTSAQTRWCFQALSDAGYDTENDPRETVTAGSTYIEGTREDLEQVATSLEQMAFLIEQEPDVGYQCDPSAEMPTWMRERVTERAIECCKTAARRIHTVLG